MQSIEDNKHIFLTQSFGKESEYKRAILAVLSAFVHWNSGLDKIKVVLYTDNPGFFKNWLAGIEVDYVLLTPAKVKVMRGEIDFLHRMKIALIEETFISNPEANIFYFDSDTFFIENPVGIFNAVEENNSFMHLLEYPFSDIKKMPLPSGETFQAFYNLINSRTFELAEGEKMVVKSEDCSWNAGVMCFHYSHHRFINDVYHLTDQFYPETKNHASEQYAFSIMLQKFTTLKPCEDIVYHYWYRIKKEIMDKLLAKNSFTSIEMLPLEAKIAKLKPFLIELPTLLENDYLSLLDNAVQTFNEDKFREGYAWYFKAVCKNPFASMKMLKDVIYHTKRFFDK